MNTFDEPASHLNARAIMGKNFLGLEDVRKAFGVALDPEQFAEIPFAEETLQACKDTHVLVAGAPLSLNEIRELAESSFPSTVWYCREAFANDKKTSVRWYLLRKDPVTNSHGKTYDQQIALLTKKDEVPFACEVAYMVIPYWLTHREHLLPDVYVRCHDTEADGDHIVVGRFDADGFAVCLDWDGIRDDVIGLASSVPPRES